MRLFPALLLLLTATTAHAQWDLEDPPTTADLRGVYNVGGGTVWASGTHGTVVRSEDGGYLCQACAVPPGAENLDFRGIQAFDENTAIVMSSGKGDLSRLYKTTDGCHTWKFLFANPDKNGFWDAVNFYSGRTINPDPNRKNGMLVGDPINGVFAIFVTSDSGETWKRWGDDQTTRPSKAHEGEALFAASNSSIVSPGINEQYCFVTGGKGGSRLLFEQGHSPFDLSSWSAFSDIPIPILSGESAGAFSIGRREESDGHSGRFVIVGGDYSKPAIGASAMAYQPAILRRVVVTPSQTPPHGYRSAVAYDPNHKLWITVGPNGTDISTDDGKNWRALKPLKDQAPDTDQHWNALSLPFVVGPKGRIGKLNVNALAPPTK